MKFSIKPMRHAVLAAGLLGLGFLGCSDGMAPSTTPGKTESPTDKGKMDGATEKGKMDGVTEKGKMEPPK